MCSKNVLYPDLAGFRTRAPLFSAVPISYFPNFYRPNTEKNIYDETKKT